MNRSTNSSSDQQASLPRRRGAGAADSGQTQPTNAAASNESAPVLLRLPELFEETVADAAVPAEPAPVTTAPPTPIAPATPEPETSEETIANEAPSDGSSEELRERRRQRQARQTPQVGGVWATTSGRLTLAGGAVVICILLAMVMFPRGGQNEDEGWEDGQVIGEAGDPPFELSGPSTEAWQAADNANTNPTLDGAAWQPQPSLQAAPAGGSSNVAASYEGAAPSYEGPAPAYLPEPGPTPQPPADAYVAPNQQHFVPQSTPYLPSAGQSDPQSGYGEPQSGYGDPQGQTHNIVAKPESGHVIPQPPVGYPTSGASYEAATPSATAGKYVPSTPQVETPRVASQPQNIRWDAPSAATTPAPTTPQVPNQYNNPYTP